jgi:hypothetical protein
LSISSEVRIKRRFLLNVEISIEARKPVSLEMLAPTEPLFTGITTSSFVLVSPAKNWSQRLPRLGVRHGRPTRPSSRAYPLLLGVAHTYSTDPRLVFARDHRQQNFNRNKPAFNLQVKPRARHRERREYEYALHHATSTKAIKYHRWLPLWLLRVTMS